MKLVDKHYYKIERNGVNLIVQYKFDWIASAAGVNRAELINQENGDIYSVYDQDIFIPGYIKAPKKITSNYK
jgi:hypothetical protein